MGENTKYNSNLQKNSVVYQTMSQIEELRAFVTIVETGSLTQAADRLGIAVSAVSRRLRDLELRLGTARFPPCSGRAKVRVGSCTICLRGAATPAYAFRCPAREPEHVALLPSRADLVLRSCSRQTAPWEPQETPALQPSVLASRR